MQLDSLVSFRSAVLPVFSEGRGGGDEHTVICERYLKFKEGT